MPEPAVAKYTAEFIGTFILVVTIGANLNNNAGSEFVCVSIACSLTVMIYALGKSSGAHFNPAVTLAAAISGNCDWTDAFFYMLAQFSAGMFAGLAFPLTGTFELMVQGPDLWWHTFIFEMIYTGMLCFVVLNVACSTPHAGKSQFYGIAIGFVIVAGASAGTSVSKGCFNPAVTFGLVVGNAATVGTAHQMTSMLLYIAAEYLGAVLASNAYFFCRPDEFKKVRGQSFSAVKGANLADGSKSPPTYPLQSRLYAEATGTFILVLTVGCNILGGGMGAFSIAASLMCMIFALGSCSGAHFNPAVTVAAMCSGRGKCSAKEGFLYILTQICAGIIGMLVASLLHTHVTTPAGIVSTKPLVEEFKWTQIIIGEFIFTFVLCFVVLSVATVEQSLTEYFGFAIGMCVTVGGYAVGSKTGGALNPAVAIGVTTVHAIFGGGKVIHDLFPCLIYTATELAAGAVAAGVFMVTQPSEFKGKSAKARETLVEPLI